MKKALPVATAALGIAVIALGIFAYQTSAELKQVMSEKEQQVADANKIADELRTKVATLEAQEQARIAKEKELQATQAAKLAIVVTKPARGQRFCLGGKMPFAWQAPKEMLTVSPYMETNNRSTYSFGTFPSSYNEQGLQNGHGEIVVTLPTDKSRITEGATAYVAGEINRQGIVSAPVGPFAIEQCTGQ
jgi:hypothetical protein